MSLSLRHITIQMYRMHRLVFWQLASRKFEIITI
jgi:hypothetical protein